jgi:hypothetical protein
MRVDKIVEATIPAAFSTYGLSLSPDSSKNITVVVFE